VKIYRPYEENEDQSHFEFHKKNQQLREFYILNSVRFPDFLIKMKAYIYIKQKIKKCNYLSTGSYPHLLHGLHLSIRYAQRKSHFMAHFFSIASIA